MTDDRDIKINSLELMMIQNNKDHDVLKEMLNRIDRKIDSIADQKADKWVEKVLTWILITVGAGVLGFIVRAVIYLEIK